MSWKLEQRAIRQHSTPLIFGVGGIATDYRYQEYQQDGNGQIRKLSPLKPWSNKSEHKAHKKARRELLVGIGSREEKP